MSNRGHEKTDNVLRTDFGDAYAAGRAAADLAVHLENHVVVPFTATPEADGEVSLVSLEGWASAPTSKRGEVRVFDTTSFCAYVNLHREPGTQVYADLKHLSIVAVLDHHAADRPGWGRHRISLTARVTDEWNAWFGMHNKLTNQVQFAEFIEDHLTEIADPSGSVLLSMIQTFTVKRNVDYDSKVSSVNGAMHLTYHEKVEGASAGPSGQIKVPEQFKLGIEPFEGAGKYEVYARLRYRLENAKLQLFISLVNPQRVVEAAFKERIAEVEAGISNLSVFRGAAPAPTEALK
jgi:uncharacterized protein YfdQ (DUF2303 family)